MSVFHYRTQAVRDLAWACFSPALLRIGQVADDGHNVADCEFALTLPRRRWLEQLDARPAALLAHLATNASGRLGIYFERLWHFFLAEDPAVDLVAHNLPVRTAGRTLGEFDCLYWCRERRRYFHLELAVKFFLSHRRATTTGSVSHWNEWLGPNSSDRLDLKLAQLLQHQARLGELPEARTQLAALGIGELAQEIAFKGYLFQSLADPLPPPFGFNPGHRLRHWLAIDGLAPYLQGLDSTAFTVLDKPSWLSPALARPDNILDRAHLLKRLQSLLADDRRARLVAALDARGREVRRFFVTPAHWPTIAH